jgi:hypothetical protein
MLKMLSGIAGFAISFMALPGVVGAADFPYSCTPDCQQYWQQLNQECQGWFGPSYMYCYYQNGWVYCCGG